MASNVTEHVDLVLSIHNWGDFSLSAPDDARLAIRTEHVSGVFLRAGHPRTHLLIGKSGQQMEMDGVQRQHDNLDLLMQQHVYQCLSGSRTLYAAKPHWRLFQQVSSVLLQCIARP
jgi:hypothetical protein